MLFFSIYHHRQISLVSSLSDTVKSEAERVVELTEYANYVSS